MDKKEYMLWMALILTLFIGASVCIPAHAETAIIWGTPELEAKYKIYFDDSAFTAGVTRESQSNTEQHETAKQHEYSNIQLSDSEREELRRIVAAEAQTQSEEGMRAVVEVIFNRVLSDKFPNTVHGVLSQKGQFATWRMRNASWVQPELADSAIAYVIANGRTVLPDTSYLYFDTRGVNGRKHIKIGAHYFGRG